MKPTVSLIPERPQVATEKRKPLGKWELANLMLDQMGRCKLCGVKVGQGFCADDHIIPLACGGTNAIENRQLLCPPCHAIKTDAVDKADAARIKRRRKETGRHSGRNVKKIQSRGFQKNVKRGFDGKVRNNEPQ